MSRIATVVLTLVAALVLAAGIAVACAMAGIVPVAAGSHHFAPIEWYLSMASDRAVERGGEATQVPATAKAPSDAMLKMGMVHYQEMCVTCHGAPGIEPSDIGKGLYPRPPRLERHKRAELGETYWIVKNGVRDTGMPAFGPTHSEDELWAIAAFTVTMPHWTPAEYAAHAKAYGVPPPITEEMEQGEKAGEPNGEHGPPAAGTPSGPGAHGSR